MTLWILVLLYMLANEIRYYVHIRPKLKGDNNVTSYRA